MPPEMIGRGQNLDGSWRSPRNFLEYDDGVRLKQWNDLVIVLPVDPVLRMTRFAPIVPGFADHIFRRVRLERPCRLNVF